MKALVYYFLVFFIYSVIGYICEVFYKYLGTKKWVNRGFMIGPYLPIYGNGALLITFLLNGYYNDPIIIFVFGLIICTSLEYLVSYIMEKMFHQKWWDYSWRKYNINGRVCLKNSLLFGFGAIVIIYAGNPLIFGLLDKVSNYNQTIVALILIIVFIIDFIISMIDAFRVNNISTHLETILNEYTKNRNIKLNKIRTRLFDAYPYLAKNERVVNRLKALKKDFTKRKKL